MTGYLGAVVCGATSRIPGRETSQLNELLSHLAFELGGNPGVAMARQMGIQVCRDMTSLNVASHGHVG
ncbi:hypothetical protein ATW55_04020 [Ferroacidibacillus organovorans]|uniref:Uncharacterized protein n=1 Tax=Ferroacidibacillus organovorans TaxID=1765683 RepID=A0A101XRV4_9BACL|nr:hypothetical protein ATW55_04020 [Ferroacidibacillus organovorans]